MEYQEAEVERLRLEEFVFNQLEKDDRGLIGWKINKNKGNSQSSDSGSNDEILYTEELIAILLKFGRQLSEKQANSTIRDCIITVPSYFTHTQKRMMYDAAEMAGLSVL